MSSAAAWDVAFRSHSVVVRMEGPFSKRLFLSEKNDSQVGNFQKIKVGLVWRNEGVHCF